MDKQFVQKITTQTKEGGTVTQKKQQLYFTFIIKTVLSYKIIDILKITETQKLIESDSDDTDDPKISDHSKTNMS